MTEEITIQIGKSICNDWRRDNLLKVKHLIDKGDYYEVNFQYVEHTYSGVKQVNLIYQIIK